MFNRQIALALAASGVTPAVGAAVLLLFWPNAVVAAGRPDYGGKMSFTAIHQEAKPLDDKGHVVIAEILKGTNVSTGRLSWMDGSEVLLSDVVDMTQGNGSAHGSGVHVKDGAAKAWTVVDVVKTTMVDGKVTNLNDAPIKDIRVHCVFTSQTTMDCEWTGRATNSATR